MIPDLCLLLGYVTSALVLTVQADGLTDGSKVQMLDIIMLVVFTECSCLGFVMLAGAFTMCPSKSNKIHDVQDVKLDSMITDSCTRCETDTPTKPPASSSEVDKSDNATDSSSYEVESFPEPLEQLQSRSRDEKTDSLASQYVNAPGLRLQDGTRVVFVAWQ